MEEEVLYHERPLIEGRLEIRAVFAKLDPLAIGISTEATTLYKASAKIAY